MFGGFGGDGNPFGVNFNLGNFPQRFDEHYRVYPVSFCDKAHLEDGDKILLPPSALETLARLHIEYPMLFKIINEGANRHSHCGVLEFSAPEGSCYMPYWMMQNLFVKEGGIINIQNISLPKASFVKIRPQSQDFLDITNQRAVLEASLRKFSCLTIGDTICIKYNNKNFLLDVREVRPAPAACIIETDCEVDFETPADYVPPPPVRSAAQAPPAPSDAPYGGVSTVSAAEVAKSVRGKTLGGGGLRLNKKSGEQSSTDAAALRAARLRRYESFHGTGQSLSGLTSTAAPVASSNRLGGRSTSGVSAAAAKEEEEEQKEEKPPAPKAAVPFQGEGRRLSAARAAPTLLHRADARAAGGKRSEETRRPEDQTTAQPQACALAGVDHAVTHSTLMSETSTSSASSASPPPSDAVAVTKPPHSTTTSSLHENENDGSDWVQKWSLFYQRMLNKFLRETYGHAVSVQVLAVASTALLLSCALYFLSPLLEDDYHIYKQYLPWVHYLDYSKYNSFVVDHVVVFLAISLPMSWLLLVNVTYSGLANRLELALLLLRIACCLTVCFSLTVILTEFLSRRVMIALLSLAYGSLGLVYSWSVPVWRWYLDEASKKGLIAFMPESLQELLLRTSLLEWLTDTSMSEKVQPFLPFLLPLSRAEQNRLLERMPVESQVMLTRPGLMPFLPESVQKALLPSDPPQDTIETTQQLTLHNGPSESSSSDDNGALMQQVKKLDLPPTAAAGFDFHRPEVKASNALAAQSSEEVLADIISNRVWNGCKQIVQMPSSKTLNRTASVSTALLVLQLYASRRSRRMFVTTLQFLLTSALGSVAACAVLLRTIQLTSTRWPNRPVPLLRYAQQYLLRNRSAQPQLANNPESDSSQSKLRKAATSASVVLAIVYAMRKLRG